MTYELLINKLLNGSITLSERIKLSAMAHDNIFDSLNESISTPDVDLDGIYSSEYEQIKNEVEYHDDCDLRHKMYWVTGQFSMPDNYIFR